MMCGPLSGPSSSKGKGEIRCVKDAGIEIVTTNRFAVLCESVFPRLA